MRTKSFNMIEAVLALGVVAIGAVSLMALFPVGFGAGRDAVAENFTADSADQFLHWFAAKARKDWNGFLINSGTAFPLPAAKPATDGNEPSNWDSGTTITDTLELRKNTTVDGLLKMEMKGTAADFNGIVRIWKDTVTVPYLDQTGSTAAKVLDTASAVAVNFEASWPAELPYGRRQKRLYRIEIFKSEY